ncbi:thiamine/thiamine pyrophosphate ABC transporter permease [Allorhizobium sp. BGMRC 0089]|uniref:thiamine/thiamine pyrophosphate ABC transporter permease n=1 Tax=Allorhizobium sonneratiae TaxID=2934936 RepID=UPI0020346B69|nr:thiamine/thiamine pyrophosphate ABC transporter permease [Allorhizobium sonneratiae]MCM2293327.1 thiamine/thiamine pyrophosphate ABC transporter permease [Allorhizobium sonneratiae]
MLTAGQRRSRIAMGVVCLGLLSGFIVLAVVSLLSTGGGAVFGGIDAYTIDILRFTLWQASLSTLISVGFALPVALSVARQRQFPGRRWLIRLMALPMGLPALIGALGILGVWGRHGMINSLLGWLGKAEPVDVYGLTGILIAHSFFNIPLAARLMLAGLERVPADDWRMAAGLGMTSWPVFRFVEWPAVRGLLPGAAGLIFMLCATSFTLVLTLGGGPGATTLEVAIYQALRFDFDPPQAVALALLQLAVTALLLVILAVFPAPEDTGPVEEKRLIRFDGRPLSARLWDGVLLVLASLYLLLPLIEIVVAGLKSDLVRLVSGADFLDALSTSLIIAFCAASLALGVSLAFITARSALPRRGMAQGLAKIMEASASLVLLVPAIVLATGWFLMLRPYGDPAHFAGPVVVAINAMMALPFAIRVLDPAIASHRARTERLAEALNIRGFAKWRHVDYPGLRRPVLMALSFAMALSLGDLGAVALFGSQGLTTLPLLVYSRLGSYRTSDADGMALLLGLVCLALTLIGTAGQGRKE